MVKTILIFAFFFATSIQGQNTSDPRVWAETELKSPALKKIAYPKQLVILTQLNIRKKIEFLAINYQKANQISFIKLITADEVKWPLEVNLFNLPEKATPLETVSFVLATLDGDFLIHAPLASGNAWEVYARVKDKTNLVVKSLPPAHYNAEAELLQWFYAQIGYEGVLIAKSKEYFLVNANPYLLQNGTQGFVFAKSANSMVLSGLLSGRSILELVSVKGPFAIFKSLMNDPDMGEPQVGEKLVLAY